MGVAINYWSVLVAAVSTMVVGSIWYGPLFGKAYISAMGWDSLSSEKKAEMKKGMGATYFYQFVVSLVAAWVLALFLNKLGVTSSLGAVKVAGAAWLGFILPIKIGDVLWGGKKQLLYLGAGNSLVTLVVMALILNFWR